MKNFVHPPAVYLTAVLFLSYTLASCGPSSKAAKELEKYDSYEFADEATFNRPYERTYLAATASLEEMRFTLTVTDQGAGEVQAEDGRKALRPEEGGPGPFEEAEDEGPGFLAVLLVIVVAILSIFVGGDNNDSEPDHEAVEVHTPQKLYVYTVRLDLRSDGPDATVVRIAASRFDYEDGDLVGTLQLENKRLNHGLFDRIEEHLMREELPVEQ